MFLYFLPISDISILYDTSVIAIGLNSVSVGLFFFGIMIVFDFFHSVGSFFSSSTVVVPHYKYCYIIHIANITSILFSAIIAF